MHPLLKQYQHTLLGRFRTSLLAEVSGSTERLPTAREVYGDLMADWKKNATASRMRGGVGPTRHLRFAFGRPWSDRYRLVLPLTFVK